MSPLKDIFWVASPLGINEQTKTTSGRPSLLKRSSARITKNEHYSIDRFFHWGLEVDGKCYEMSAKKNKKLTLVKLGSDMGEPRIADADNWHKARLKCGVQPIRKKVGQTRMIQKEIEAEVKMIWKTFNKECYWFFTQNCQNLAKLLYERVAVKDDGGSWEKMPKPVSHPLADISRNTLIGGLSYGSRAWYLGSLAYIAEAAEVGGPAAGLAAAEVLGPSAGALGMVGASNVAGASTAGAGYGATAAFTTATGESIGAAGSAASTAGGTAGGAAGTAGGTATTAGTAGTATTAGTAGTATTAGTAGTAGTVGTTGTGTTVGTAGTAHTAAGGSAGAAKGGIFAKSAGLGHGAFHGALHGALHGAGAAKAATVGGGMVKAGTATLVAHPLVGVTLLGAGGGLVYLFRNGKKDKEWLKNQDGHALHGDSTVFDVLELEDRLFSQDHDQKHEVAKKVDAHLQDLEQTVDEELTEKLDSTHIEAEPAALPSMAPWKRVDPGAEGTCH